MVVFATNIKPAELVDEAFLRRIHYKMFAESPTPAGVPADLRATAAAASGTDLRQRPSPTMLVANYLRPRGISLRGCHPATSSNRRWRMPSTSGPRAS